jgi:MEDS: MEthanogen/methylotroph, DcmR Sensory domain/Histidine kinase
MAPNRHACAFFHTPEEEYQVMLPFITEGIEQADKIYHIVDPARRTELLRQLRQAGIDTDAAHQSGQLKVHPWEEAHIRGHRFDQEAWLGLLEMGLLRTHPMVVIDGMLHENPFFVPPDEFLRELRDSVSQALYGIALNASAAEAVCEAGPSRVSGLLRDVVALAEAGLAEMRALIFELRPKWLQQEGLVAALDKLAAAARARHGLEIQCALGPEPRVPLEVKEALYRIAQEALQNMAKHARARSGELVLAEEVRELVLRVVDDGQGFDPSGEFPGHLGLRSMQERAAAAGGVLQVDPPRAAARGFAPGCRWPRPPDFPRGRLWV